MAMTHDNPRLEQYDGAAHTGWPRLEVSCKYHRPARFEETLEICLRVEELRTSSVRYGFWVFSADATDRAIVAVGTFTIIHVELDAQTREIRKAPIPAALREKLEVAMNAMR